MQVDDPVTCSYTGIACFLPLVITIAHVHTGISRCLTASFVHTVSSRDPEHNWSANVAVFHVHLPARDDLSIW